MLASNSTVEIGSSKEVIIAENLASFVEEDRELGVEAVFTISSAKPGNGVEQLRDNNPDTYWQSDGTFPHLINVQFLRKVSLTKFCLYLDHNVDESYTPKKLSVSVGTCVHDLIEISSIELHEPVGWVIVDLTKNNYCASTDHSCVRAHFLQLKVSAMHQNGKDTHIRQVRVFGKRESQRVMADLHHDDFKTTAMSQFCVLR